MARAKNRALQNTVMASSRTVVVLTLLGALLCFENACIVAAKLTKPEVDLGGVAEKYNNNHAPVVAHREQSQLHQNVVRALRTAVQYSTFAAVLDNMTQSVIRPGITLFAPNNQALSSFQNTETQERVQDVIGYHIVTDVMPFSNLLRLDVGSRLITDVSNLTILVTSTNASAYEVEDALIVDPDLYTDATIAVHGINAVFNTTKIVEEGGPEEEADEPSPASLFPFVPASHASSLSIRFDDVAVYEILTAIFFLCFLKLSFSGLGL